MTRFLKSLREPLLRMSTVRELEHDGVFETFAQTLMRAKVRERVRGEPRVVMLRQSMGGHR